MSNITGLVRSTEGSVKVGTNASTGPFLVVNPDGSINVTISGSTGIVQSLYNEANSVASGATVVLNTYTVPALTTAAIEKIELGGGNIAIYEVFVNAVKIDKKRTYFGSNLSTDIIFGISNTSLLLSAGDVLQVKVTNFRPTVADFESRIQVIELI